MREVSVNQFRSHLGAVVDASIQDHEPLRITRRGGKDFVVLGAEDWAREQETLHILQNSSLMAQIAASQVSYREGKGYTPAADAL